MLSCRQLGRCSANQCAAREIAVGGSCTLVSSSWLLHLFMWQSAWLLASSQAQLTRQGLLCFTRGATGLCTGSGRVLLLSCVLALV